MPGKARALDRSAQDYLPKTFSLPTLQRAAAGCRGCELYKYATQTVFGEGPATAELMLVGEVPGDQEDLQGHPFVRPAGRILDEALDQIVRECEQSSFKTCVAG